MMKQNMSGVRNRKPSKRVDAEYHSLSLSSPTNSSSTEHRCDLKRNVRDIQCIAWRACVSLVKWAVILIGCSILIVVLLSLKHLWFLMLVQLNLLPDMSFPEQIQGQTVTELTGGGGGRSPGRVFMVNNGIQDTVLKMYPTQDEFEHTLYIQKVIEESNNGNITVPMVDFDREQRWIAFEAGIPINTRNATDHIPDVKSQLMHIQHVLQSLGIIHNDVRVWNFLLSKADNSRILIFDFGRSLMVKDTHLLFNSLHVAWTLDRIYDAWTENRIASFWDETFEFENMDMAERM